MMGPVLAYVSMRMKVGVAYGSDLVWRLVADLIVASVGLVIVATIYTHVPLVRGYTVHDVLLCWGLTETALGVFQVFGGGLYHLNRRYLLGGELDRCLMRPIDPLFQVLADHLQPGALSGVAIGLLVVFLGASGVGEPWTLVQWLYLPLSVASGASIVGGLLVALCSLGFWMQHQGSAVGMAYRLTVFARYPLPVYPMVVRLGLVTVAPFAFVGFIPASFYMRASDWWVIALAQPLMGALFLGLGVGAWRFSLARYTSSGT